SRPRESEPVPPSSEAGSSIRSVRADVQPVLGMRFLGLAGSPERRGKHATRTDLISDLWNALDAGGPVRSQCDRSGHVDIALVGEARPALSRWNLERGPCVSGPRRHPSSGTV